MTRIFLFAAIILVSACQETFAQEYPDTFAFVEVLDPLSGINPTYPLIEMETPAVGDFFFDLHFGTVLVRTTETDGIRGRHEYSRFDPFNKDQSMIILDPVAWWNVYSTQSFPYNQVGNFIITLDIDEPRWDPNDPNLIWGLGEFSIETVNVSTGQTTVIKDFSVDPVTGPIIAQENIYRITTMGEGESSLDKRYWAFFLQGDEQEDYNQQYIFTWDGDADTVLGVYEIAPDEIEIDCVGMSALGNWVWIAGEDYNGGNLVGLTMANKELTQFHRLDYTSAHSDVGLDSDGNEVIVMQNVLTEYIDLIPIDLNTQPILDSEQGYENTNRTPLVRLFYSDESPYGFQSGFHISCNVPGYCVISTYIKSELQEQNWLDRTNILVRLDRSDPRAFYLSKVYNTRETYWEGTQATISNDGSKIVWASNWNQNVGQEEVFLMQLDMPPNWRELITSVEDEIQTPRVDGLELMQNYPNPFNVATVIGYSLPVVAFVELGIYNLSGQQIRTLLSEIQSGGIYQVDWDARDDFGREVASGLYFFKLEADSFSRTKKLLLLR